MNGKSTSDDRHAKLFQSIGELVMATQWVESRYRELGSLIEDPDRAIWPPRTLRKESLAQHTDFVTDQFGGLIQSSSFAK